MSAAGLETAIPAVNRLQAYALNCAANGGDFNMYYHVFEYKLTIYE